MGKRILIVLVVLGLFSWVNGEIQLRRVIDTFSTCVSENKCVPCGWYSSQNRVNMFSIGNENGNRFVKIRSEGSNTSIAIQSNFNPSEYPILSWRWRVHAIPIGAVESIRKRSDSAAGVYVIFHGKIRLNRIIKYVWSSSLHKGEITESPFNSRVKIVVLRSGSGPGLLGQWVEEMVNIADDYKQIFNADPPSIDAIAIMSDADNTKSLSEADYDDFWISKIK